MINCQPSPLIFGAPSLLAHGRMIGENTTMNPRAYDTVLDAQPCRGPKKAAINALLDSMDSKKPFDPQALASFDPSLMPALGDPLAYYCMTISCMRHDEPARLEFLTQRLGYPIDGLFPYSMGRAPTTPLCLAMSESRWLVAEALLDLKADPNRLDGDGMHPLALAGLRDDDRSLPISLVDRFAKLGQDFNWSDLDEKSHCSVSLAEWNLSNTEALARMAQLGCSIEGANEHGETLLMLACQWGCWESALTLLDLGVDPLATNRHGARGFAPHQPWLGLRRARSIDARGSASRRIACFLQHARRACAKPLHDAIRLAALAGRCRDDGQSRAF